MAALRAWLQEALSNASDEAGLMRELLAIPAAHYGAHCLGVNAGFGY
ncbi:hypothetical protein ACLK1S_18930 [Escherichia coli]